MNKIYLGQYRLTASNNRLGKKADYIFIYINNMCVLVAQSCLILCDLMDCSLPGSSVHGILQERILEWDAIPFSIKNNKIPMNKPI